ncbi:hypothetical protein BV898_04425 [Hypsibius exemplaris]|uniref:Peptidase M12A domain-containing protein n=1 Tax=Hypsibius exemplaris TaxID=2072580 RepID=A0A1W0X226_HYPEX|nr:hypothetical protein BV898_04425 [Hypsibius exemplaris]
MSVQEFTFFTVLVLALVWLDSTCASTLSKFPMTITVPDTLAPRATANRDIRYDVWSNPQRILYRLDDLYNETTKAAIREAMAQIARDMSSCIRFEPYNVVTDSREDHLVISPQLNSGTRGATCITFPGRVIRQNAAGQKLVIFQSANGGCLASKRETMAIIIPVLGVRQEIKRPDRDQFIRTFPNNVLTDFQSFGLLNKYEPATVDTSSTFDFLSITMPSQSRFAKPNTVVYSPINATQRLGEFARLSLGDCQGIKKIYPSCGRIRCSDPYSGLESTAATATGSVGAAGSAVSAGGSVASSASATGSVISETGSVISDSGSVSVTTTGSSLPVDPTSLTEFSSSGAGTVILAAFQAVSRPHGAAAGRPGWTIAGRTTPPRSTTTPLTLQAAFQSEDIDLKPIDPPSPFNGLEFWLDTSAKKN